MSKVIFNEQISSGFYMLKAEHVNNAGAGQFYMVRAWGNYPVLSRPLSVFDADGRSVTFLYKAVGEGTNILAGLCGNSEIELQGPYGNGFPVDKAKDADKVALVGGGAGIAPLYLTAKKIKESYPGVQLDIYLGFSGETMLVPEFEQTADNVTADIGGYITDKLEPCDYGLIFTCGPEAMMSALYKKCAVQNAAQRLYVSMENRMACGIGACLVCSCKTEGGNRKVCKDGPVFEGKAVFGL